MSHPDLQPAGPELTGWSRLRQCSQATWEAGKTDMLSVLAGQASGSQGQSLAQQWWVEQGAPIIQPPGHLFPPVSLCAPCQLSPDPRLAASPAQAQSPGRPRAQLALQDSCRLAQPWGWCPERLEQDPRSDEDTWLVSMCSYARRASGLPPPILSCSLHVGSSVRTT